MSAPRILWRAFQEVRLKGYAYIWANLAFVALCLPVFTAPAALSALFRVSYEAQTSPSTADLALFWQNFKANIGRGVVWGVAHGVFAFINFSNLISYANADDPLWSALRFVWIGSAFVWFGVVLYTWPLYYSMAQPNLWISTRNALVMVLQNPLSTLMILIVLGMISVLSTLLVATWLLLTFGIIAAVGTAAVLWHVGQPDIIPELTEG